MLIDCDTCRAPATACGDCVMTVLLQIDPRPVDLDATEREAIDLLAGVGLVPPLRLVVGVTSGFGADEPAPEDADLADESEGGGVDLTAGHDPAETPVGPAPDRDDMPANPAEQPARAVRLRGIA